jgi:hypothetical protein
VPVETTPPVVKPPIGVMPKYVWDEQVNDSRKAQLLSAIERYRAAGKPVKDEWVKELAVLENQKPNVQRLLDAHTRFQIGVNRALHQGQRNEAKFNRDWQIFYADLSELGIAEMFDWD